MEALTLSLPVGEQIRFSDRARVLTSISSVSAMTMRMTRSGKTSTSAAPASTCSSWVFSAPEATISFRAVAVEIRSDGAGRRSVSINLTSGCIRGAPGAKTISSIENAFGSLGDDTLIGNGVDNTLEGSGGDDHIEGRGGDDLLYGGLGTDFLDGGRGADLCDLAETGLSCEA